jgi:hypothetical protein
MNKLITILMLLLCAVFCILSVICLDKASTINDIAHGLNGGIMGLFFLGLSILSRLNMLNNKYSSPR